MKFNLLKNLKPLATALVLLVASSASAQTPQRQGAQPAPAAGQSMKGAVLKGKAPVNRDLLKVNLPKAQEATLPNGLRVLLINYPKVPTFAAQLVVLSGGLSDPAELRGVGAVTAAMLREGTKTRSSRQIAEAIESIGATLTANSGTSAFTTNVNASGLVENVDEAMNIFADVVRNPTFPKEELDKYKTRQLAQYQFLRSNPQFLAQERFNQAIYGEHPAALLVTPVETLKQISTADLTRFHGTYYRPNNAILAVVGDITMKDLMPKVERAFGDWQKGDVPPTQIAKVQPLTKPAIYLIDRPGSVQTVLQLGNLGIERTNPDYFSVLLMNRIFGGGPSARLFMNLREDKGYTYGAYSNFGGSKFPGTVSASSEVRTDVTEGALKEFMYEIKRIRDERVSPQELEDAKRALIGSFALSLEQPQTLLSNIILQKLYDLPVNYWETYPQRVAAVTPEDVQRAAQKYVDLPHLQIIAVGDAAKAREALAKYGTVEVYTVEGKPAPAGTTNEPRQQD
jgi:predicted Zn-dependent peptidase